MLEKASSAGLTAIGVDTGGARTYAVIVHCHGVKTVEIPATPGDMNVGILEGIDEICASFGLDVSDVPRVVCATTYVTDLFVKEKEASVALLTTEGFRDVLESGRASREPGVYDIHWRLTPPLVPGHLRFVVKGRKATQASRLSRNSAG